MQNQFNVELAKVKAPKTQKVPIQEINSKKLEVITSLNVLAEALGENVSYLHPIKQLRGTVGESGHEITGSWLNDFGCEVLVSSSHFPPYGVEESIRVSRRFNYNLADKAHGLEARVSYVIESRDGHTQKMLQVTMNNRNVRRGHLIPEKATLTLYLDGPRAKTFVIMEEATTVQKDRYRFLLENMSSMIPGIDLKKLAKENIEKPFWANLEATLMQIACVGKFPEIQAV